MPAYFRVDVPKIFEFKGGLLFIYQRTAIHIPVRLDNSSVCPTRQELESHRKQNSGIEAQTEK